ncbi:cyclin-dependent kinase inhibitor 7-like isoform X1 [Salvia hispanica]|uniref:cyclin-dependent kinase inhibitor 7-like isoform X1 n=1 Tax=Salvia hispanica TaxID=49212 RepID=UPI002009D07E|nr:cyclin-dependent kinase inhibitor 7-like isoform X1 [Salvia hispanica]
MGEFSVRIKCRAMEEDMRLNFNKKRKVYSELENESCGEAELAEDSPSPAASRTSSCSKREDSNDVVKMSPTSPDLENADSHSEGFVTEISASTGRVFSREATPTSELCGDSEHVSPPPTSRKKSTNLRRKTPNSAADSMPSAAELEAFFAAAEKYEQKRFSEKYNYDIVKDVPLEGKYQWVRLLP